MATFLMFGKYNSAALQQISSTRTDQARQLIQRFGGNVEAIYATLGDHDLVCIVTLPGLEDAMKVSVALGKLTGIAFSTAPALPVEQFDRAMTGL